MKNAVIVHGMPSKENYFSRPNYRASEGNWLPWLKAELAKNNIIAATPEMPRPYEPDYEAWKAEFERCQINEDTILIGHSCGGGFLVRWLSENKVPVGKVVLVAPWIDPNHEFAPKMFNDLVIDPDLLSRTQGVTLLISMDDEAEELQTLEMLKNEIKGLEVRTFTDKGHFLTPTIPEVLAEVLPSATV